MSTAEERLAAIVEWAKRTRDILPDPVPEWAEGEVQDMRTPFLSIHNWIFSTSSGTSSPIHASVTSSPFEAGMQCAAIEVLEIATRDD